ncbi:MAG TPA: ferritin-like domain-containing protein [Syntrophomonadaceae bacterium]|nr:ferritin-like domain-containing protein [Syntrophomonadaceae bacterium]
MANQKLLDMIIEAMKDEKHDHKKYRLMMNMTSNSLIRKEIRFAYVDEGIHYKLFRNLYHQLTGKWINVATPPVIMEPTLLGNVKTSIDGELAAVELYRKIYSMLKLRSQRDTLFRIITDEQEHATRFVYVYAILTP